MDDAQIVALIISCIFTTTIIVWQRLSKMEGRLGRIEGKIGELEKQIYLLIRKFLDGDNNV